MRSGAFSCALFVVLLAGADASGHDGPPEPLSLRERGDGADGGRVMGASFGLLQSVNGDGWDLICSEAIGYDETYEPVVHWSAGGSLFVGSPRGLFVSRDGGCSWSPHQGFTLRGAADVRGAPGQPNTVFVTSGRFGAQNGVFRSDDDGFAFAEVITAADTQFTGVRFAPSAPMRAYVSAWSLSSMAPVLYRSDDAGQSFTALPSAAPWSSGFTLVAVAPSDPNLLFASVYEGTTYVLLRSENGGAQFVEVARDLEAFRSIAFEPGSATVWAAASRMFRSDDDGKSFVKALAPKRPGCVTNARGEVEACGSSLDGFALSKLHPDGGVQPTFTFHQTRGLLPCAAGTTTHDACTPLLRSLSGLLGFALPDAGAGEEDAGTVIPDAGEAGVDAGSEVPPPPRGCGCTSTSSPFGIAALLVALKAARRRRYPRPGQGEGKGEGGSIRRRAPAAALAAMLLLTACPTPPQTPDGGIPPACDPNPCTGTNRTTCAEQDTGAVTCTCDPGFHESLEGACVANSACDPNPCTQPNKKTCVLGGAAPVCSCDQGFIANAMGACVPAPADCSGQHTSGDGYEPDECPEQARDIGGSGAQNEAHTIDPATDVDWLRVDTVAGRIFRIEAERTSGGFLLADAWMGSPLAPVGSAHGGTGLGVDAAWKAPAAGTLYFRLSSQPGTTPPTSYSLSLGDLGEDDAGDDLANARATATNTPLPGALQFNGDVDVLSYALAAGHSFRIDVTGTTPITARWFTASGAVLLNSPNTALSFLTRSATGGAHALHLSGDPERSSIPWSATVTDLGVDDHGDTSEDATWISSTDVAPGALERAGDVDVFAFEATKDHIYAFTCTPVGLTDCLVSMFDPAGATVVEDVDGGVGSVIAELAVAGRYTVHVQSGAAQTGTYSYQLVDLGLDDHGDDAFTATALGMPPIMGMFSGTAKIETAGDRDFLSFIADGDHIYRITCTRTGLGDCNLRIFNLNGLPIAQDVNGGDAATLHEYLGGGTFLIELSGGTGSYVWKIEDLFHEDHGDDVLSATSVLANNAYVSGLIQTWTDADWFRFTPTAGNVYRLNCTRVDLPDCHLAVLDELETTLAQDVDGLDAETFVKTITGANRYLEVTAPMAQLGGYSVKVEDLGADDAPETSAGAPAMSANGISANGLFEFPGDEDVRQLSLNAGTPYQLTATGPTLAFTLIGADGMTVVASGSVPASFTSMNGGLHFLEVHAVSQTFTGGYSLAVTP